MTEPTATLDAQRAEDSLNEIEEYLNGRQDVLDGDDGRPKPNRAMQLLTEIERLRAFVRSTNAASLPETFTLKAMMPEGLHPATKQLVFGFACALANKLHTAEKKYGYSDGWLDSGWMDECRAKLREHIEKGDPRDVAAYCAFLWHHKQSTASLPSEKAEKYAKDNPLGGPAKMFEAIASRIRAGEDYYAVLDDYDLQHKSPPSASERTGVYAVRYERVPQLDKRIANGDDFAGDAWVRWVAVGHTPFARTDEAPPSPAAAPDPYPDNEADGVVFCGKCGGQR